MKLYSYFSSSDGSNTYLVACKNNNHAMLVDPLRFDINLLELIEHNNYCVTGVLITRIQERRGHGLRSILKIYDAEIVARGTEYFNFETREVVHGNTDSISGIDYESIVTDNYVLYRIGHYLFMGNSFSSGQSCTPSIRQIILSLDSNCIILSGNGPPTTVEAELKWNPYLSEDIHGKPKEFA